MLVDNGLGFIGELKVRTGWVVLLKLVPITVITYNLLWAIYNSFFSRLRNIPGPFLARISRVWEMKNAATGNIHEIIMDLHRRHGEFIL
jgi:hypothetical protein